MNTVKMLTATLINNKARKNSLSESDIQLFTYHRVLQCIHINSVESEQLKEQITQKKQTMSIELLRYTNELIRILALFQKNEVNIICLKGPVIGQKIYHSIGLRMFRDLDLLIDVDNLSKGYQLLKELGYVLDKESEYDARRAHHVTTYMGVQRDENGAIIAHSWTMAGEAFMTGKRGHELYTVTKIFSTYTK